MKYLYIDESYDESIFVVGGIIANNENDVNKKHKRYKNEDNPASTIQNWMRGKDVIEFLGLFKELNNSNFKPLEFEEFGNKAESNAFTV